MRGTVILDNMRVTSTWKEDETSMEPITKER